MNFKKSYFVALFFIFSKSIFAMETKIGEKIPKSELPSLQKWDERKVTRNSIVAFKEGSDFVYALLDGKQRDGSYTVIILQKMNRGVQSTHGRITEGENLRIIVPQK